MGSVLRWEVRDRADAAWDSTPASPKRHSLNAKGQEAQRKAKYKISSKHDRLRSRQGKEGVLQRSGDQLTHKHNDPACGCTKQKRQQTNNKRQILEAKSCTLKEKIDPLLLQEVLTGFSP